MSFDANAIIHTIETELRQHVDEEYRIRVRDHYQMDVTHFLGVRTPIIRKIANTHYKPMKGTAIDEIFPVCAALLETQVYEHKIVAFHWSYLLRKQYQQKHFEVFQSWLATYVDDWIDCDDFCTHTLGEFLLQYPECLPEVKEWTVSSNRWMKRASAVSLIYSARRGKYLPHILDVADRLLSDPDELVQKGYGWMLKEATKSFPQEIFDYLMEKKAKIPRLALRYAVEKLPVEMKQQVLKKGD